MKTTVVAFVLVTVALVPSIVTVAAVRFVPLIVIVSPPVVGPLTGDTFAMVGDGGVMIRTSRCSLGIAFVMMDKR